MTAVPVHSVTWQRLDLSGEDTCRIVRGPVGWHINGEASFLNEHADNVTLAYEIHCDRRWHSVSSRVKGHAGTREVLIEVDQREGRWFIHGVHDPALDDLIDLDFGFTPATNLLPIRRLQMESGGQHEVHSAWLNTDVWCFQALAQEYALIAPHRLQYRSPVHGYEAELIIDDFGCVIDYPNMWCRK